MLQQENQTQSANLEGVCQALSATGEPCDTSATCHCGICGKWFCAFHASSVRITGPGSDKKKF